MRCEKPKKKQNEKNQKQNSSRPPVVEKLKFYLFSQQRQHNNNNNNNSSSNNKSNDKYCDRYLAWPRVRVPRRGLSIFAHWRINQKNCNTSSITDNLTLFHSIPCSLSLSLSFPFPLPLSLSHPINKINNQLCATAFQLSRVEINSPRSGFG